MSFSFFAALLSQIFFPFAIQNSIFTNPFLKYNLVGIIVIPLDLYLCEECGQVQLSHVYKILDIDGKDYTHKNRRGVFFEPLYTNTKEFLCDEIRINKLTLDSKFSEDEEIKWWVNKSRKRYLKLKTDKVFKGIRKVLFYKKLTEKDLDFRMSYKI